MPAGAQLLSCSSVSNGRTLIGDSKFFPCGPVNETTTAVPCCQRGNTCMEGGLCSYTSRGTGAKGYYTSGCTDPSFADPACKKLCMNLVAGDVVYNGTAWRWQCCANHQDIDCANPLSDETFDLPAPNVLRPYFKIPSTGVTFTSVVPTAAPTYEATPTPSSSLPGSEATNAANPSSVAAAPAPVPAQPSEGPISHSAAAGIGVVVTASVALIAWAVWFFMRRTRAKKGDGLVASPGSDQVDPFGTPQGHHRELESPVVQTSVVEMSSHRYLAPELQGTIARYELDANAPSRGKSRPTSSQVESVEK